MDLTLQIEDIIEKNGSDFELSKLFKAYIKEYKESLPELFDKNQGKDFLVRNTRQLDSIISLMYKTVLRRVFGNYLPMRSSIPIAIVALGSYGREQLCVHSDIDLLIVYEKNDGFATELIIQKLFYLAIDAGLKLGHRVHEVSDLFHASNEDITIKTALMESRFIVGSNIAWLSATRELNKIRLYEPKKFILAKITEAQARRKKYPVSMQPNIKESVGGLRDANLIFWVAKTIYGVNSLKELTGRLFLEEEYRDYRIALELLFRVRSALHLISKKQEDRLLLEYIPEVTRLLGFANQQKMVAKVLEAQWRISNFTQIFVKKMTRPYIVEPELISQFRHNRIEKGIYKLNDRLYASYNLSILPLNRLLEVLVRLEDKFYHFDAGFINQLTYTKLHYPLGAKTNSLLRELLRKKHSYPFLKLFYDAGILHHLFHAFKKVLHLPQFDGYHHYAVDIHSIKAVEALENITDEKVSELFKTLTQDEKLLLKIATLYHDTGKGRHHDHSEVGAKLVVPFAKKLKLKDEEIERCVVLVKSHTLMSSVAFKENIHNEKILYKFMSSVQDATNLKLLYILTYADISGVGEGVYSSFGAKLLNDLYVSALEVAQDVNRITDASKRLGIEKKLQKNAEFAQLPKLLQNKLLRVESNFFFFKHSVGDIIEMGKRATKTDKYSYFICMDGSLSVEIYRKIPFNIGYLLASLSHLDVASMEIYTLFDDVKYFKIEFIESVSEDEKVMLEETINNAFDMSMHTKLRAVQIRKDEVTIDCEHSLTHAEIAVNTQNQKGLLAYIMEKFELLGINIVTAKIHSTKHKVKDSFLIDKKNNLCDNTDKIFEELICAE